VKRSILGGLLPYSFFFAIIVGLLAINYWAEVVLSHLARVPYLLQLRIPLTHENLFYFSIAVAFLLILALWEKDRSSAGLQYSFLTVITHKFRTPLGGMRWAITGLRNEKTLEERKELLQELENAAERITQVVDTLTGLAKFSDSLSYAYEAVSLRDLVGESMRKYAEASKARGVTFTLTPAPDVPLIVIDRQKVQFVVDVLIENAIKYSNKGGTIEVVIEGRRGKYLELRVVDHGMGISFYDRRRLFKKFFRAKDARDRDPEGMGLSLPLVKTVMNHHRGTIKVFSWGRGKGATFVVRFPVR